MLVYGIRPQTLQKIEQEKNEIDQQIHTLRNNLIAEKQSIEKKIQDLRARHGEIETDLAAIAEVFVETHLVEDLVILDMDVDVKKTSLDMIIDIVKLEQDANDAEQKIPTMYTATSTCRDWTSPNYGFRMNGPYRERAGILFVNDGSFLGLFSTPCKTYKEADDMLLDLDRSDPIAIKVYQDQAIMNHVAELRRKQFDAERQKY